MMTLCELETDLYESEEIYSEIAGENASERALYGDSSPGSAVRAAAIWQSLCDLRREIAAHPDYVAYVAPTPEECTAEYPF